MSARILEDVSGYIQLFLNIPSLHSEKYEQVSQFENVLVLDC